MRLKLSDVNNNRALSLRNNAIGGRARSITRRISGSNPLLGTNLNQIEL